MTPPQEHQKQRSAWTGPALTHLRRTAAATACGFAFMGLFACSGVQTKQRLDGTYVFECSSRKACLDRAERTCGLEGYVVVGGHSNKKLYGVPGNEKLIGKDEIFVRCNKDRPSDTPDGTIGSWHLKDRDSDVNAAASVAPEVTSAAPPKTICRPGETQRCVGPAACSGGQACLQDGSGFSACDCGTPSASVATPAAGAPAR
ncbi:MAG TPA: hypothetical protein VIV60_24880 [Polyangiaceae bacterium]